MRSIIRNIVYSLAIITAFAFTRQGSGYWKEISKDELVKALKEVDNQYRSLETYSLTVTHASYKDYTASVPADKATGYFIKDKNNYHSFLLGIHTIQNSRIKVVADTSSKVIILANPDKVMSNAFSQADLEAGLKACRLVKVIELNKEKTYRMEFAENYPFTAYEMKLSKDGLVKELVMFYNRSVQTDPDDKNSPKVKPRVVISFSGFNKDAVAKSEFDETRYVAIAAGQVKLAEKYRTFKVLDQRVTK